MLVRERTKGVIQCRELRIGDWIHTNEGDGWTEVIGAVELPQELFVRIKVAGHFIEVTPSHPFCGLNDCGEPVEVIRAGEITLSHQLFTKDGADFVEEIKLVRDDEGRKMKISCSPYHTFLCGENEPYISAHNTIPLPS
jgi:hypothetical protein